jgi:four helix bundle protein
MADYRRLEVWGTGRKLAAEAYRLSALLPESEKFNLRSQIQRAAVSIPANIAEGSGRGSDRDFARFVRIVIGSLNELDTLVLLSTDVDFVTSEKTEGIACSIRDLAVRLRNLATRLESNIVCETVAVYGSAPSEPSSAIDGDRPQP